MPEATGFKLPHLLGINGGYGSGISNLLLPFSFYAIAAAIKLDGVDLNLNNDLQSVDGSRQLEERLSLLEI